HSARSFYNPTLTTYIYTLSLHDALPIFNSDDPAYFGGYIDDNYAAARSEMNLSGRQIVTLARNSFDACFSTEAQRIRWKAELERSEEHTSELQSRVDLVCRLLLEKKNK